MELDEAEAAQHWAIPWHEWEETPRASRLRMTATVFARNLVDAMRAHDHHKDIEHERAAARNKRKGKS